MIDVGISRYTVVYVCADGASREMSVTANGLDAAMWAFLVHANSRGDTVRRVVRIDVHAPSVGAGSWT